LTFIAPSRLVRLGSVQIDRIWGKSFSGLIKAGSLTQYCSISF
jgi:hypothetical protein